MKIKNLTMSALFAAVIFIATAYLPRIPIGTTGYVHIGDTFIYIASALLPFPYAPIASAIGGAMADLVTGYTFYVPFTFAVKFCLSLLFTRKSEKVLSPRNIAASFIAIAITYVGYLIPDTILTSNLAASALTGIMNAFQGIASMILFIFMGMIFDKANVKKRLFSK